MQKKLNTVTLAYRILNTRVMQQIVSEIYTMMALFIINMNKIAVIKRKVLGKVTLSVTKDLTKALRLQYPRFEKLCMVRIQHHRNAIKDLYAMYVRIRVNAL